MRCPKDFKPCIDSLCRGGGCIQMEGEPLLPPIDDEEKERQSREIRRIMGHDVKSDYWVMGKNTYIKRDSLKRMGCTWDKIAKAWLIKGITPTSPFMKWVEGEEGIYLKKVGDE